MKTFYQIEDEGGEGMHHHWRLTCTECGTVITCRCSQPKTEASGICFDCCEKAGISYQTGLPLTTEEMVKMMEDQLMMELQIQNAGTPVIAVQTKTLWHLSNAKFTKFDPSLSGQGIIWFSDNVFDLVKGGHGASLGFGKPVYLYKCQVRVNKTAGRDEYEKFGIGELKRDGYDSVELEGDWAILNSRNIRITHVQQIEKKEYGMTATVQKASKCREILPPTPFDFKQPCDPPVVFLGGAIDMGAAEDWQKELIESLSDVSCVALNPRRKDWDSSWTQSIDNPQFREQVEWELKGLEQASLVVICLTKDSKAPISLLELGLHVVGNRMMVFCPEGFYRKGNVDIVCNRYGVPVYDDFDDFKMNVKARLLETSAGTQESLVLPAGTIQQQKDRYIKASDLIATRMLAREFIVGMRVGGKVVCPECGQMTICQLVRGDGSNLHFNTHLDRAGHHCKGSGWAIPMNPDKEEWGMKTAGNNHKEFKNKKEALDFLSDHALMSVGWPEGKGWKEACYFNGKIHITDGRTARTAGIDFRLNDILRDKYAGDDPMAGEKMSKLFMVFHSWATKKGTSLPPGAPVAVQIIDGLGAVTDALRGKMGLTGSEAVEELMKAMSGHFTIEAPPIPTLVRKYKIMDKARSIMGSDGETHPWGSSPLSRRPDYGVRDGEISACNELVGDFRVKVVTNRIVSAAKEFLG